MSIGQVDDEKKRAVFFELGGSGGFGSVNYEQSFYNIKNTELNWRLGFSMTPIDRNNGIGLVFPIMVNALIGERSHKLELGLGQGITISTKGSFFALTTGVVGYRYQTNSSPWFYRVSYAPLISYILDFQVQHWGGLSIGYAFKSRSK